MTSNPGKDETQKELDDFVELLFVWVRLHFLEGYFTRRNLGIPGIWTGGTLPSRYAS